MRRSLPLLALASRHHRRLQPDRGQSPPPPTAPADATEAMADFDARRHPGRAAGAARAGEPRNRAGYRPVRRAGRRLRVPLCLPPRGRAHRRDAAGASAALRSATAPPAGSPASIIAPPTRTMSRRAVLPGRSADRRPVRPREHPRGGGRRRHARRQRDHRHRGRHRDQGQCRQSRGAAGRAGAGRGPARPPRRCAGASAPGSRTSGAACAPRSPS